MVVVYKVSQLAVAALVGVPFPAASLVSILCSFTISFDYHFVAGGDGGPVQAVVACSRSSSHCRDGREERVVVAVVGLMPPLVEWLGLSHGG